MHQYFQKQARQNWGSRHFTQLFEAIIVFNCRGPKVSLLEAIGLEYISSRFARLLVSIKGSHGAAPPDETLKLCL